MMSRAMQGGTNKLLLSRSAKTELAFLDCSRYSKRHRMIARQTAPRETHIDTFIARGQKQSLDAPDLVDRSADEGVSTSGREVNVLRNLMQKLRQASQKS